MTPIFFQGVGASDRTPVAFDSVRVFGRFFPEVFLPKEAGCESSGQMYGFQV